MRLLRGRKDEAYENVSEDALRRFWAKVEKTDTCWIWTAKSERFHATKELALTPRRLTYRLAFGCMPEEQQIRMACRNLSCVNPEHMARTDEQKFWALVKKADDDACWEWQGGIAKGLYGAFAPRTGVIIAAHRYAYETTYGPIEGHVPGHPELEVCVCHRCDNPKCVRPDHLFLGHDRDNMADKIAKGRQAKGEALSRAIRAARERKAAS